MGLWLGPEVRFRPPATRRQPRARRASSKEPLRRPFERAFGNWRAKPWRNGSHGRDRVHLDQDGDRDRQILPMTRAVIRITLIRALADRGTAHLRTARLGKSDQVVSARAVGERVCRQPHDHHEGEHTKQTTAPGRCHGEWILAEAPWPCRSEQGSAARPEPLHCSATIVVSLLTGPGALVRYTCGLSTIWSNCTPSSRTWIRSVWEPVVGKVSVVGCDSQ